MGTLEPRKDTFRRFSLKAKTHTRLEVQAMFQQSSTNVYHKKRKRKCLKTIQPELSVLCDQGGVLRKRGQVHQSL